MVVKVLSRGAGVRLSRKGEGSSLYGCNVFIRFAQTPLTVRANQEMFLETGAFFANKLPQRVAFNQLLAELRADRRHGFSFPL